METDIDTLQQEVQQLLDDDKQEQALIIIDKILELDSNSAQTHYKKGNILQLLGQYESSIDAYENASNINPDHPGTYYNMGIAYDEIGLHGVRFFMYLTRIESHKNIRHRHRKESRRATVPLQQSQRTMSTR
jgi:tetratricopeptide (TPR) repeat protein